MQPTSSLPAKKASKPVIKFTYSDLKAAQSQSHPGNANSASNKGPSSVKPQPSLFGSQAPSASQPSLFGQPQPKPYINDGLFQLGQQLLLQPPSSNYIFGTPSFFSTAMGSNQAYNYQQSISGMVPDFRVSPNQNVNPMVVPDNSNIVFSLSPFNNESDQAPWIRLLHSEEEAQAHLKVVAVIVTFVNGFTYDSLFSEVKQKSVEGTRVLVYACGSAAIVPLLKEFKGQDGGLQVARELVQAIQGLDPDCVVFNWECCSGYSIETFPEGTKVLHQFTKLVVDRGHMAMFSDFSLKALINTWDQSILGPRVLKKVGQKAGNVDLYFDSKDLMESPSAQLQVVAQLADGTCSFHAADNTIMFTVDPRVMSNPIFQAKVLTVAVMEEVMKEWPHNLTRNGRTGVAGHVLLRYKSGGSILASMGHWIELMKIDTTAEKFFQAAEKQYGPSVASEMLNQYQNMSVMQQKTYISTSSVAMIQNQVPCSNMISKSQQPQPSYWP